LILKIKIPVDERRGGKTIRDSKTFKKEREKRKDIMFS